ncbi:MAG: T9SS C-terminal target domain-containing protein [Bacteroidetes bacterium]|nr:MAG: T9SS C-terminal target domain-containing protein [Bacteroidota bacterium]REK00638.1 MAG: T9SS C-terminal target domain-containing protein [Bacteroidota bacterium]REK35240.1 MAG: T9SS C-terminal target domain-containing protein [Bacteroidota bacterium]REK48317.1 MAG: T9SS C-terminal target domain-containing protein [Bacteroidota bacterium]
MRILILAMALLAGVLNSNAQLTGTFTIGGSTPDYATFNDAVNDLSTLGISGPVVFNVRNGTYTERVIIPQIIGSNATNTVTFKSETGDSTAVILTQPTSTTTTDNFTMQLNGADYITFRNMTISRVGTDTYGTVVNLTNSSNHVTFENNILEGSNATTLTTNSCVVFSTSGVTSHDTMNVFNNNLFLKGSYGLYYLGASTTQRENGTRITNNTFTDNYGRAIHLGNQISPVIIGNVITTTSTYATFYGLYFTACAEDMRIERNKTSSPNGGYGMYFTGSHGLSTAPIHIINNFIHAGGSGTAYGIFITGSSNMNIWHNSIHVTGTGATSRCFYVTAATSVKLIVQNNIMANTGGGMAYYITSSATTSLSVSDFNDLYSTGPNLAFWNASNINNITTWRDSTGRDVNSVSADPIFVSASDLHAFGAGIDNVGIPIAGITTDIDGDPRNPSTPDIGADEFTPFADNLVMLGLASPPALGACGSQNVTFSINVGNIGSNDQSNIPVQLEITGPASYTFYDTIPGPIPANTNITHTFPQSISTVTGGQYFIQAFSSLGIDQYRNNDTILATRNFYTIPNSPTAASPQQGCDNNTVITATPDPGDEIVWYDQANGGNPIATGSPLITTISTDTVFYAESRQGSGVSGCLRIVECSSNDPDYIEIQNLSGATFDATGYVVAVSNSYTDINSVNANLWNLGVFAPGEIQYKSDNSADNYWGSNILWNPGSNSWAIIIDPTGNVVDFIAWDWNATAIQGMAAVVNGFTVNIGNKWNGNGIVSSGCNPGTLSRTGNSDNDDATDFVCEPGTKGVQNANLTPSLANCGLGICGSIRIPVQVNVSPGVFTDIGPDTILASPFSYVLDAGPGFSSYLWSDGTTGQTITVTTDGWHWVTVTGANGCTWTDSMSINLTTGIKNQVSSGSLIAYPNPAANELNVQFINSGSDAIISLMDMKGSVLRQARAAGKQSDIVTRFNLEGLSDGVYFVRLLSSEETQTLKVVIQRN